MQVAIVKYDAGNVFSVMNAVRELGAEPIVTDKVEELMRADRIIFPGQGEARSAMESLKRSGLQPVFKDFRQPVLGICIGMQLLCRHSEEGDTEGLGIFPVEVKRFRPEDKRRFKVPCMGWNSLTHLQSPLFKGVNEGDYVYFVHSYYAPLCDATIAEADYVQPYSAALQRGNFFATQFHPEKSAHVGRQIIKNFLDLQL